MGFSVRSAQLCWFFCGLIAAMAAIPAARAEGPGSGGIKADPADEEFFEAKVRPVLAEHCLECHGAEKAKAGLRLDARDAMLKGGDGGPAVVPGKPDESTLVEAIRYDGDVQMPPKGKLKDAEIAALTDWVKRGAHWPGPSTSDEAPPRSPTAGGRNHPSRPSCRSRPGRSGRSGRSAIPAAAGRPRRAWPASPIDRFILARLESDGPRRRRRRPTGRP